MAPRSKSKSTTVFIVVSSAGIDSVHADLALAQSYAIAARQAGHTSVRTEVYTVIDASNAPAPVSAPVSAVEPAPTAAQAVPTEAKKDATAADTVAASEPSTEAPPTIPVIPAATPAKPKSEAKSKDAKVKEPKSETKPKDAKVKESKSSGRGRPKDDGKAKSESTATASAPAASGSLESTSSVAQPSSSPKTAPATAVAATPSKTASTPAKTTSTSEKTSSKTIPAEDQRAANAKKSTKSALEDLPTNIQSLLSNGSDTLTGLLVVVTGIPPVSLPFLHSPLGSWRRDLSLSLHPLLHTPIQILTKHTQTLGRKNTEKLVEAHGGKLGKSITGKTNLVVLGNDAGPKKLEQINELRIATLDEDGLVRRLEGMSVRFPFLFWGMGCLWEQGGREGCVCVCVMVC